MHLFVLRTSQIVFALVSLFFCGFVGAAEKNTALSQSEFENLLLRNKAPAVGTVWCQCDSYVTEGYREYQLVQYKSVSSRDKRGKSTVSIRRMPSVLEAGFITENACESAAGRRYALQKHCPAVYRLPQFL